jgi:hypothetical protein
MSAEYPAVMTAPLPATYEAAKAALAECSRIDECQTWANKAEAMASYARQSEDTTLHKMADRIQARAIRRCGELLKQIEPAKNQHGRAPTRAQAAEDAGLSEHQRKTALRVANVSMDEFERQVEGDNPPTVTALADQGRKTLINLNGMKPRSFADATQGLAHLRRLTDFAAEHDGATTASGVTPDEARLTREHIEAVRSWLNVFENELPDASEAAARARAARIAEEEKELRNTALQTFDEFAAAISFFRSQNAMEFFTKLIQTPEGRDELRRRVPIMSMADYRDKLQCGARVCAQLLDAIPND